MEKIRLKITGKDRLWFVNSCTRTNDLCGYLVDKLNITTEDNYILVSFILHTEVKVESIINSINAAYVGYDIRVEEHKRIILNLTTEEALRLDARFREVDRIMQERMERQFAVYRMGDWIDLGHVDNNTGGEE